MALTGSVSNWGGVVSGRRQPGSGGVRVDVKGGFPWQRRTGNTIYISIRSDDGTVESNRLILRTT